MAEREKVNLQAQAIKKLSSRELQALLTPVAAAIAVGREESTQDDTKPKWLDMLWEAYQEMLARFDVKWLGRCGDEYDSHEEWAAAEHGTIGCP